MFKKTMIEEQTNQHQPLKPEEKTETNVRKLLAIKNELSRLKRQYEELRLLLEDKCEVLPYGGNGFAELNTVPDRKIAVKDPFRTERSELCKKSFETGFDRSIDKIQNPKQHKKPVSNLMEHLRLSINRSSLATFSLIASGLTILAWVGWLTWYDATTWNKDVILIFFGSRTGEAISLNVGMKVVYYFGAGIVLFLIGLIDPLRKRRNRNMDHLSSE